MNCLVQIVTTLELGGAQIALALADHFHQKATPTIYFMVRMDRSRKRRGGVWATNA